MLAVIIVTIWKSLGYAMIFYFIGKCMIEEI